MASSKILFHFNFVSLVAWSTPAESSLSNVNTSALPPAFTNGNPSCMALRISGWGDFQSLTHTPILAPFLCEAAKDANEAKEA